MIMRALFGSVLVAVLTGCIATPNYVRSSQEEINGVVRSWRGGDPVSSPTLSIWKQKVLGFDYALFQLRTNPEIYRFALSRSQLEMFLGAVTRYQLMLQQPEKDTVSATEGLYRTEIRLMQSGESSWRDRLLVNVERKANEKPVLALTFDTWFLSFGRAELISDRVYKQVEFAPEEVSRLRHIAESVFDSR